MKVTIPIKDILPNPYQVRKKIDRKSVKGLAEEIKTFGLWPGALRGRLKKGKVELCHGHRRLEALKLLGWRDVEIEIADLSDEDMTLQSLAENLQREDLTDIEKAEAISMMIERLVKRYLTQQEALQKVSKLLGLSETWVKNLLSLLELEPHVQEAIRQRKIAGRTAMEAYRFGGAQMVSTAIKHSLPVHKISKIAQKIREIPVEEVRRILQKEAISGLLTEPKAVERRARQILKRRGFKHPENLEQILVSWSNLLSEWSGKIDDLLLYKKHLNSVPKIATRIKRSADLLVKKLEELV